MTTAAAGFPSGLRVALVHDWLTGMRGGERVLAVLCQMFPDATLHTLVHVPGTVSPTIERLRPHTSFLQHVPNIRRWYRHLLPLYPAAIRLLDVGDVDLVISTSHCVAKSVVAPRGARHLCYCFTPVRYAYDQFDAYFGPARAGWAGSTLMRPAMRAFAWWDTRTSGRPDRYVAISQYVARRIARYYTRTSSVVYPPVDTTFFTPTPVNAPRAHEALIVSALVPYKRLDIAVAACRRVAVPLTIVGTGPDESHLRALAGPDVTFAGTLTDTEIRDRYRTAAMVLLPGEEDFGIVPLEAQACGTPVVALARGGATETVRHGETGLLTDEGVEACAAGIRQALATSWSSEACRRHAEQFSTHRFVVEMTDAVTDLMGASPTEARW